jgi:hypothetical protein
LRLSPQLQSRKIDRKTGTCYNKQFVNDSCRKLVGAFFTRRSALNGATDGNPITSLVVLVPVAITAYRRRM